MDAAEHRQIIAALDALLADIDALLQRFADHNQCAAQKADYLALHALHVQAQHQRAEYYRALAGLEAVPPSIAHTLQ